ncbi:MAG: response regulator, partial [Candidatus Dormibacteraceae bacterium]
VVEDDPVVAEVNSSYVERVAGFVVVGAARSGGEAVAAAQDQPVDLILLDFYLPDMSGLDVCRALRAARTPPVDIIAVTAARDADTVRAAIAHGVVQYLIKPYSFASFREKLQRYAAYHQRLPSGQITSQPELDQMLNTLRGSTNAALPKRLAPNTYELIIGVLRNVDQPLTATEIARASGTPLTRCTARRYLDHLHQQGLVVLTSRYGTTGRPEHLYQWAEQTGPR